MRLLQVGLRSSFIYALIVVLISIPVSLFSIRALLNREADEALALHADQFIKHIEGFNYLDDLESDLEMLDQLSYDIDIAPSDGHEILKRFESVSLYDSSEHEISPFRELTSTIDIKGKHYVLTVRMSQVDNEELIFAIALVQSALIILLVTGLLLLNRSLSRKLWKPFYKTLNQLKAYELDKNESIVPEKTNITEFDDFNKTVINLTDRNRKAFHDQKEFIENASHELQTPLAIFQSKLDVLMQKTSMSEAEATIIMELEETAQRMSRLNKSLLLLSKIDNEQFNTKENITLSNLINNLLADVQPMADLDHIVILGDLKPVSINANKTLIEVLLINLLHNAIRHTTPHGKVTITLVDKTLTISNTGLPLKMDAKKIFDRFSKESTNTNSTGLGLAIVKRICDTCLYKLTYQYNNNAHIFSVTFNV